MRKRPPGREFTFSVRDEWLDEVTVYVRVRIALKRMLRGLGLRITDMRELTAGGGDDGSAARNDAPGSH